MPNELKLIELAKNGDESALEELLLHYTGQMKHLIRPYYLTGASIEDLLQEAMLTFYKAVLFYDEEKGDFGNFLSAAIKRRIIDLIKKNNNFKNIALTNYETLDSLENKESGEQNPEETYIEKETRLAFGKVIQEFLQSGRYLSEKEKSVLTLYLDGLSYDDIAAKCAMNVKSIDNALQRIKKKLIKKLDSDKK